MIEKFSEGNNVSQIHFTEDDHLYHFHYFFTLQTDSQIYLFTLNNLVKVIWKFVELEKQLVLINWLPNLPLLERVIMGSGNNLFYKLPN